MDYRSLKVGDTVWYVNTHAPDYDAPHPSRCLELWKGTVKAINPDTDRPVDCTWDRVGGYANWVKPEWGWGNIVLPIPDLHMEHRYDNPNVFPIAEEAIEAYLEEPRTKLLKQAHYLKGDRHGVLT